MYTHMVPARSILLRDELSKKSLTERRGGREGGREGRREGGRERGRGRRGEEGKIKGWRERNRERGRGREGAVYRGDRDREKQTGSNMIFIVMVLCSIAYIP